MDRKGVLAIQSVLSIGIGVAIETFLCHPPPCAEDPGNNSKPLLSFSRLSRIS